MVIRSASYRYQCGFSLAELLLASAMGLVITAALMQSLVVSQKSQTSQIKALYLRQSLADALRYLTDDLRRAGYNGNNNSVLTGSATAPLSLSAGELSYVYKFADGYRISAVKFDVKKSKLLMCSARRKTLPAKGSCKPFFSLLDDRRILLKSFRITEKALSSPPSVRLTTISLTAELSSGSEPVTMSSTLFVRNQRKKLAGESR